MNYLQYLDFEPKDPKVNKHYYKLFEYCLNFIPEPGEEIRQSKRIPYWFVTNHGRCFSLKRFNHVQLSPFKKSRDYYYTESVEFGNKDVKMQHLVAEIYPDQVRIDPNAPKFSSPYEYELHHIIPFDESASPYVNNRASNLQWLYIPNHRRVTAIQRTKTKMDRLTKKYGAQPITKPVVQVFPLDAVKVFEESAEGGISSVKNEIPKEVLKGLIAQVLESRDIRRILAHIGSDKKQ